MSTLDAGIAALRAAFRAALPAPDAADGVEVFDGPAEGRAWAPRAVTVASAFEDGQNAVAVARSFSGARPHVIETVEVACSVYVGSGDADEGAVAVLRTAADAIFAALDGALRADRTLGGVVGSARITRADLIQGRDSSGTGVIVGFVVALVAVG